MTAKKKTAAKKKKAVAKKKTAAKKAAPKAVHQVVPARARPRG